MAELAVALLDGEALASALAVRTGVVVRSTTVADHLDVAGALSAQAELVVGLACVPWPTHPELHAEGSATLPAYTGVVSWHALPALHDVLAAAVEPAVRRGAHVLITAPDPGPDTEAEDVLFLREVAEGIAARTALPARSIAWRGTTRSPTATDALASLASAHERQDVVECPVAPGTRSDPALEQAAAAHGLRFACLDVGRVSLLELLTTVVRTVAEHESAP